MQYVGRPLAAVFVIGRCIIQIFLLVFDFNKSFKINKSVFF